MAANVETMFSVREKPWHGLGTIVTEAPASADAIRLAGLDWTVVQEPIYTNFNKPVEGYRANVRSSDRKVLGVVSDRYKVVQNVDAFSFTDELLGKGVRYETAGSLQEGRKVWLLARLPREYIIAGERISPYLVFSNTHDGSGSVKVAVTPVRVVCNNTLNLALDTAKRSFSMIHTGNIQDKIQEAKDTLFMAEKYMDCLGIEFEQLRRQKITDEQVREYIELLLPMEKEPTEIQRKNIIRLRRNTEKEKSQASDSFKRACFNWGIGRELYTAPFIWIPAAKAAIQRKGDKYVSNERFTVSTISFNDNREITSLEIVDAEWKIPMRILSNQKKCNGAACILYPGVLEELAGKRGNLFIIPSSIHETILLPDDETILAGDLKKMIHEVNTTQVSPDEVLSDSLYYYDAVKKEIVMA